ncbi:MAG TPA: hypothetical protein VK629_21395, partial [Steroidobacteraceae bacterium]|nr:hypothetical protein [Steroidobacteraceae bacterium]
MRRHLVQVVSVCILVAAWPTLTGAAEERIGAYDAYYGNYLIAEDHLIGINPFIMDNGEKVVLFADYSSGVVRRLFAVSDIEFSMGPGFNSPSPVELTVRFEKDEKSGTVKGVSLRRAMGKPQFAERVALKSEDVSFDGADAKLSGTLITPATRGPHPVIVLLHGSGPLTRYSFGPYPYFFTSFGMAVLIYDKRGTGTSTGVRMDASTATVQRPTRYPDDLVNDALAALHLLRERNDIDPKRIGFWGSSEGG